VSATGIERTLYVGAARAEAGWVAVAYGTGGFDHAAVFEETGGLWGRYEDDAVRLVVGLPIGLRGSGEEPRPPDRLARRVLGPLSGTVYEPPVREATRKQRYPTANRVHRRKTGRTLSKESFEAAAAIAELDSLLGAIPEARDRFLSGHPELCYRAFAGDPLEQPGETAAGYAERLRILAAFDADAPVDVVSAAEATAGHEVRVHDVLDATALALTAFPGTGRLHRLRPDAHTSELQSPTQIAYPAGRLHKH
jgi:predicted RNase H-like nuclease